MFRGSGIAWEEDDRGYAYLREAAEDGSSWSPLRDQRQNRDPSPHPFAFPPTRARQVRLTITGLPGGEWTSTRELLFIDAE